MNTQSNSKLSTNQLQQDSIQYHRYATDDEISLIDLWLVVVRRKKIVLSLLLMGIIAGGAISFFRSPVYESKALVEIGFLPATSPKRELLDDPKILAQRIKATNKISVDMEKDSKRVLSLKLRGNDAAILSDRLSQIVQELVERHKQKYEEFHEILNRRLESVKTQINEFSIINNQLEDRISDIRERDSNVAALLLAERAQVMGQMIQLQRDQTDLQLALAPLNSQRTQVVSGPTRSENPVRSKTALYFALSTILGLIAGIFSAFFAEFIAKAKAQLKINQNQK